MLIPQGSQEQALTGQERSVQSEMLVGCLDGIPRWRHSNGDAQKMVRNTGLQGLLPERCLD